MENPATRYVIFAAAVFLALSFGVAVDQHKCMTITAIVVLLVYTLDNYGSYRKFLPSNTSARVSSSKKLQEDVYHRDDRDVQVPPSISQRAVMAEYPVDPPGGLPDNHLYSEYSTGAPYMPSPSFEKYIDHASPLPMPHPYQRTIGEMYKYRQNM
jgi:hypothetical protein